MPSGRRPVFPGHLPLTTSSTPDYPEVWRLTRTWSIWSAVVITLALASYPRWDTIILVNSSARLTLDSSSEPLVIVDDAPAPAYPTIGDPELGDWRKVLLPLCCNPPGLLKSARA